MRISLKFSSVQVQNYPFSSFFVGLVAIIIHSYADPSTAVGNCFHTSGAAGLNSGQFNREKNLKKANIEYRIMNIECRIKEFYLFYLPEIAERSDSIIRHSMKFHTSGAAG